MKKVAFITGTTGQDGSYLLEYLLSKNYTVHGIKRRSSSFNTQRIDHLYQGPQDKNKNFYLHYGDLTDGSNLFRLINQIKPNEIYNLAAQSHVAVSFETPEYTANTDALGTLRILECIKTLNLKKTKFYQASTSEMFGKVEESPQNELSRFAPQSPYATAKLYSYWITKNYRDAYNIFASNGILFNHESPRRGETFVSRKISMTVAKIFKKKEKVLYIGNLNSKRDWGHAKDYVESMWSILNYSKPSDFIIASGKNYTVRQFVTEAFKNININISWSGKGIKEVGYCRKDKKIYVKIDKRYFRPLEVDQLLGDFSKAKKIIKWQPTISFKQMVKEMVIEDIKNIK